MENDTRDLQCPTCGYLVVNDTGIGAIYCGPHIDGRGGELPAVQMRTIRDWAEFQKNGYSEDTVSREGGSQ